MFERYTEDARKAVFFGRYEASQFGARQIDTHHLLLGLLKAGRRIAEFVLKEESLDSFREEFASLRTGDRVSTSVDLPLSEECKRALAFAAEEAERVRSRLIAPIHLLAGLVRERHRASEALGGRAITLEFCRGEMLKTPPAAAAMDLDAIVQRLPLSRYAAAQRILEAMLQPEVTITVTIGPESFTITLSEPEP